MKYIFLILFFPSCLSRPETVVSPPGELFYAVPGKAYDLSRRAIYLSENNILYDFEEVSSGKLDALFTAEPDRKKHKGTYEKNFWVKFELCSQADENTSWILRTDKHFSEVVAYIIHGDERVEKQRSGWSIEPSRRSVSDPDVIFNLSLSKREVVTVYLHINTNLHWSLVGRPELKLISGPSWNWARLRTYNFLSIYAGICLLATFYWLINFIFTRKVNYLYLILAVLSALFFCFDIYGITAVFWPRYPWYGLAKYGEHYIWFPLMVISHFAVSYKANAFVVYFPRRILWWYWALCFSTILSLFIGPFFFTWGIAHSVSFIMVLLCMGLGVAMITWLLKKRGFRSTGFAFLAILPFFIGISNYVLISFRLFPHDLLIITPVGTLLSVIMYFYGMVHYVRILREKRNAEILKNDELIRQQNIILERTVEERTSELLVAERLKTNEKINSLLKEQELRSVSSMLDIQERERRRIASDLHDRLGSMLSTVKLYLGSVEEQIDAWNGSGSEQYDKAVSLLDEACDEIRKISHDLVSGELLKFGLTSALRQLAKTIEGTGQLKVNVITFGLEDRLENSVEITLYRVVQELVNNILKHAKASFVNIQLTRTEHELNIMVEDNGIGFDLGGAAGKGGMGIKNVCSRVGKLDGQIRYDSAEGRGTTTMIDIPI